MLKFPSGNEYKLVYFDTNFLSEFINNENNFAINVLKQFFNKDDPYMICTSIFNIYELSKTNMKFEEKMKLAFDKIPIGIVKDYQSIILLESEGAAKIKSNDVVLDSFGLKPLFKKDIHDLLNLVRNMQEAISQRDTIILNEILLWEKHRENNNSGNNNKKKKQSLLLSSMNEITKPFKLSISMLGNYRSVECMAFIKNEFIYQTKIDIKSNSIIDMYNISILPYVEAYATENFVGKKIDKEMRKEFSYIKEVKVFYIKDFKTPPHID